jgi:hypothetical protein
MLVLFETGRQDVVDLVVREFEKAGKNAEAMFPRIDRDGLSVE